MTVYVDNMNAAYGRMIMCHMIADTVDELHNMADTIGVSRRHYQSPPRHRSHYDICLTKKELAIKAGAIPITLRQSAVMSGVQRRTGIMPVPSEVEKIIEGRALDAC